MIWNQDALYYRGFKVIWEGQIYRAITSVPSGILISNSSYWLPLEANQPPEDGAIYGPTSVFKEAEITDPGNGQTLNILSLNQDVRISLVANGNQTRVITGPHHA